MSVKKYFNGPSLLCALLVFVLFVVAACSAHYWTAGVFVSAQAALLYVALAAVGALALLIRRVWFALFFYAGCVLGWASGRFVGSLEGEFAPTAGLICTFFLMAVFAAIGIALEWKRFRYRRRKERARREQQQREDLERERRVMAGQAAKAAAQAPAQPQEAPSPQAGGNEKEES